MGKAWKMSPKRDKTVLQIVEKALIENKKINLPRGLLRGYIRKSNLELFENKPSNLKKLDRYLKKAFETQTNKIEVTKQTKEETQEQRVLNFLVSKNPKLKKDKVFQDTMYLLGYSDKSSETKGE
jgi:hypothetical protein